MTETQFRAVIMDINDPEYRTALRIDAPDILWATIQAINICESDWMNMTVISVEQVNAVPM